MSLNLGTLFLQVAVQGDSSILRLERQLTRTSGAARGLAGALAGIATGMAARKLIDYSNTYTEVSNRVKLSTDSVREFRDVQQQLANISVSTASDLEATALLYGRMEKATSSLSLSQEELLRITETVTKAVALGGSNVAEASGAIRQFTQAIGGDFKTSGQELNSILEQTPGLARAIAQGLGTTEDKLKGMGIAGELSAEKVIRGLQKMAASVDKDFDSVSISVDKSFGKIESGATMAVGRLDEMMRASKAFAEFADQLANVLSDENFTDEIATVAMQWLIGFEQMQDAGMGFVEFVHEMADVVPNALKDLLPPELDEVVDKLVKIRDMVAGGNILGNMLEGVDLKNIPGDVVSMVEIAVAEIEHVFGVAGAHADALRKNLNGDNTVLRGTIQRDESGKVTGSTVSEENLAELELNKQLVELDDIRMEKLAGILEKNRAIREEAEQRVALMKQEADADVKVAGRANPQLGQVKELTLDYGKLSEASAESLEAQAKSWEAMANDPNIKEFTDTLESTLGSELKGILQGNFDDIGDSFKNMLQNMVAEALAADIMNAIGLGASGGGAMAGLGAILGFADGGNPPMGRASIVGEEGPELIVPRGATTVIPNNQIGEGKGDTYNINISSKDPESFRSSRGKIVSSLRGIK